MLRARHPQQLLLGDRDDDDGHHLFEKTEIRFNNVSVVPVPVTLPLATIGTEKRFQDSKFRMAFLRIPEASHTLFLKLFFSHTLYNRRSP